MSYKPVALLLLGLALATLSTPARTDDGEKKGKHRKGPVSALEALTYLRQNDFTRAALAYEQILRDNPNEGKLWHNYAFALHSLKRYDDAIKAWQKSMDLGFQPATGRYNLACAHALAGRKDEALACLEQALNSGFSNEETLRTDSDLNSLRYDARFKKLLGSPPEGLSREQRWRYDLDYLIRRMEKVHYNLYAKTSRQKFQAAVEGLNSRTSTLSDEEMAVGVQSILALAGDGHTRLAWHRMRHPRYPIELYAFKEGLYVRGAARPLADLAGLKVLKIGKCTAEEALTAVTPLCSRDNAMGSKLETPQLLTNPAVLSYLKIADDSTYVSLVVEKKTGEEATVELKPALMKPAETKGFVYANTAAKNPQPLAFKNNHDNFWFEYLPGKKMVYFQYNEVGDKSDETLAKFCERMFSYIKANTAEYLVIDLRNNSGGNNTLNQSLIHGLIRCDRVNRPGHLFVLIGRQTFSAAMNAAVDIERNTHALFVGEPTGSSPNHVGEGNLLRLPCSGLLLSCASLYWQSSTPTDQRPWIAPALAAEPSMAAFVSNRDRGMEAIFAYIDANVAQ